MSNQSKNKTLVTVILLLLITNFSVIGYFLFFNKKKKTEKDGFAGILKKDVGFTQQQADEFTRLKSIHWAQAKAKMDDIVKVKNTLYDLTRLPEVNSSMVKLLTDSIGNLQKAVELHGFNQVVATRKICTPQQLPAYDSLVKRIINKRPRR